MYSFFRSDMKLVTSLLLSQFTIGRQSIENVIRFDLGSVL